MSPTLYRSTLLVAALMAMFTVSCAKKSPAPPAAPPSQPSTPVSPATPGTQTTPSTPSTNPSTTTSVTAADLRIVYFELDSYSIGSSAQADLDANARILRDHAGLRVTIEGHCDERGTVEYNIALGQKRADAVRDWLLAAGVPAGQLSTLSKGKEFPAVDEHDDAAWAKNRRAEFK